MIIVSDSLDAEANCNVLVLHHKLFPYVRGSWFAFPLMPQDCASAKACHQARTMILQRASKRCIIVMLTPRFFYSLTAVTLATLGVEESKRQPMTNASSMHNSASMKSNKVEQADLVPVLCPWFEFPTKDFFDADLRSLVGPKEGSAMRSSEMSLPSGAQGEPAYQHIKKSIRSLFKIICVNFNTQASDSTITHNAQDVLFRIQSGSQTAHSATRASHQIEAEMNRQVSPPFAVRANHREKDDDAEECAPRSPSGSPARFTQAQQVMAYEDSDTDSGESIHDIDSRLGCLSSVANTFAASEMVSKSWCLSRPSSDSLQRLSDDEVANIMDQDNDSTAIVDQGMAHEDTVCDIDEALPQKLLDVQRLQAHLTELRSELAEAQSVITQLRGSDCNLQRIRLEI